jgi:hypothetical protein
MVEVEDALHICSYDRQRIYSCLKSVRAPSVLLSACSGKPLQRRACVGFPRTIGNVLGMYFFGYGNYVSSAGYLGLTLTKHLAVNAGYQLGSRLVVNNKTGDRIGLHLTQQGAIVGLEARF